MPKRKRQPTKTPSPTKKATPQNPTPTEPSKLSVTPSYDQMPDTVEDPAAVFKMAMLEMKRIAVNNKLAVVAQEHEKRVQMAVLERDNALKKVKAELRDAEEQHRVQKQAIEKQYGIALRVYTYNDETGVLTKRGLEELEEEGSAEQQTSVDSAEENTKTLH